MQSHFNQKNMIILLENHGLICGGSSFVEVFNTSMKINQLCKEWLIRNSTTFKSFSNDISHENSGYLFPDAVVLRDKMKGVNQYMLYIQGGIGLKPRFLPDDEIEKLLNMKEEKYRMALS